MLIPCPVSTGRGFLFYSMAIKYNKQTFIISCEAKVVLVVLVVLVVFVIFVIFVILVVVLCSSPLNSCHSSQLCKKITRKLGELGGVGVVLHSETAARWSGQNTNTT